MSPLHKFGASINLSALKSSASKIHIFVSEESKSPAVEQFCLFHCSHSASHETQAWDSGFDQNRTAVLCLMVLWLSFPHEKLTILVIFFFSPYL